MENKMWLLLFLKLTFFMPLRTSPLVSTRSDVEDFTTNLEPELKNKELQKKGDLTTKIPSSTYDTDKSNETSPILIQSSVKHDVKENVTTKASILYLNHDSNTELSTEKLIPDGITYAQLNITHENFQGGEVVTNDTVPSSLYDTDKSNETSPILTQSSVKHDIKENVTTKASILFVNHDGNSELHTEKVILDENTYPQLNKTHEYFQDGKVVINDTVPSSSYEADKSNKTSNILIQSSVKQDVKENVTTKAGILFVNHVGSSEVHTEKAMENGINFPQHVVTRENVQDSKAVTNDAVTSNMEAFTNNDGHFKNVSNLENTDGATVKPLEKIELVRPHAVSKSSVRRREINLMNKRDLNLVKRVENADSKIEDASHNPKKQLDEEISKHVDANNISNEINTESHSHKKQHDEEVRKHVGKNNLEVGLNSANRTSNTSADNENDDDDDYDDDDDEHVIIILLNNRTAITENGTVNVSHPHTTHHDDEEGSKHVKTTKAKSNGNVTPTANLSISSANKPMALREPSGQNLLEKQETKQVPNVTTYTPNAKNSTTKRTSPKTTTQSLEVKLTPVHKSSNEKVNIKIPFIPPILTVP